jgi:hypothetical protein
MKVFGMRTVTVNGNVIYIIKVRVKDNGANTIALTPLTSINGVTLSTVSGKHCNMIEINYFGLSNSVSNDVFRKVGKALKQVQINNVNAKYAWTEPYYCDGYYSDEFVEEDLAF